MRWHENTGRQIELKLTLGDTPVDNPSERVQKLVSFYPEK